MSNNARWISAVVAAFLLAACGSNGSRRSLETQIASPAHVSEKDRAILRLRELHKEFSPDGYRIAILDNDLESVRLFLAAGMSARGYDTPNNAIDAGPAMMKLLIDADADVNARNEWNESLVMNSVGKPEVLKVLIDAGADVNRPNDYDMDPLDVAILSKELPSVKLLIAAGAKVNRRNKAGATPLRYAVEQSTPEIARELIKAGADVDRERDTLLKVAKGKPEMRVLIEKARARK